MKLLRILPLLLGAAVIGCQSPTLPNPNDPADMGNLSADNLDGQMKQVTEDMGVRFAKGEITDAQRNQIIKQAAVDLLKGFDPHKIDPTKAWVYGNYLITAEKWKDADEVERIAVDEAKAARNEDRRVNDSLRLANVQAHLGQIPEAIKTARSVFDTPPEGGVPILYAVLYDIIPAARGKGQDLELAKLLVDAIHITMHVKVLETSVPGRQYLGLRFHHVNAAWDTVVDLYNTSHHPELAAEAEKERTATTPPLRKQQDSILHDDQRKREDRTRQISWNQSRSIGIGME